MKIMVAYDGTNAAKEALYLARKYAKAFGASADVVTSMRRGKEDQQGEIEGSEQGLEWAKSAMEAEGVSCQTHLLIRGMSAGEDLVKFAEDNDFAAIFIGVRRRSKVGKIIMGSAAQYVILKAPCPVVTVK
jgi:nucleotide-binding universal stress UspA family protein